MRDKGDWRNVYLATMESVVYQSKDNDAPKHDDSIVHVDCRWRRGRRKAGKDQERHKEQDGGDIDGQPQPTQAPSAVRQRFPLRTFQRYASDADRVRAQQRHEC